MKTTSPHIFIILAVAVIVIFTFALFTDDLPFSSKKDLETLPMQTQTLTMATPEALKEVNQKAESQLDPKAIQEADIAEVKAKAAEMKEQEEAAQITEPLTDVAPPPPEVDVTAAEHPYARLQKLNPPPPQSQLQAKLPKNTNITHPPRWNKTIAEPRPPQEAPDPYEPPPIKVNPARVPQE